MAEKKGGDSIPEVDVLLKGLLSQPGAEGFLVFNDDGIPVKWTNNGFIKPGTPNSTNPIPPAIIHNTALLSDLTEKAKATAKKLLGEGPALENGELNLLRLHTRTNELIIAPAGDCTLAVVQKSHSAAMIPLVQLAEAQQLAQMADEKKGGGDKK